VWQNYRRDAGPLVAAAASFYAVVTLVPLFLLAVSALGYWMGSRQALDSVLAFSARYAPADVQDSLSRGIHGIMQSRRTVGIVGTLALLWAGSEMFTMLERGMNLMWGARQRRWLHARLIGFAMLLLVGAAVLTTVGLTGLSFWLGHAQIMGKPLTSAESLVKHVSLYAPFVLSAVILYAVYRILPNTHVDRRAAAIGALLAATLWQAMLLVFRGIVLSTRFGAVYGSLAGAAAIVFWIHYTITVVMLGAETAEYATERFVGAAARNRQPDEPEPA
jgi:membrane protein